MEIPSAELIHMRIANHVTESPHHILPTNPDSLLTITELTCCFTVAGDNTITPSKIQLKVKAENSISKIKFDDSPKKKKKEVNKNPIDVASTSTVSIIRCLWMNSNSN